MLCSRFVSLAALVLALVLPGCATRPAEPAPPTFLLLGEVHDNPDGHAKRFQDLKALVDQGWRPAIAMEQFDLDRAGDLDAAQRTCADADCVIRQAGGSSRWDWPLYRPVIDLALQHRLPLVAANLSRADASRVVRGGLETAFTPEQRDSFGLPQSVPPQMQAAQQAEVERGHCGLAPAQLLPGLARAQIARDIGMAQAMMGHASRGAVLLAGNGHVRNDIGVPFWLRQRGAASVRAVAYVERAGADRSAFDTEVLVPPFARPDPCAKLTMPPAAPPR